MRPRRLSPTRAIVFCLALAVLPAPAAATDSTWNADASGNWSDPANWTAGVPDAVDDTARLTYNITAPQTVTIDGSARTVGSLYISDDACTYTLAGKTLNLDVTSGWAYVESSCDSGLAHTISARISLFDATTIAVNSGTLHVSGVVESGVSGKGITKTGSGTLYLGGANIYYKGTTTVAEGVLSVGNISALGTTVYGWSYGSTVSSGATLELCTSLATGELTLNGAGVGGTGALRSTGSNIIEFRKSNVRKTPIYGA